jgi:5'-3' exonuclease
MISRIISGDSGDNIVGIEGIGEKRATAIAREHKTFTALLEALPLKGRSKYIQNLNVGKDILIRNEKLINLIKYNEEAILSGKGEEINLETLNAITTFNH